MNIDGILGIWTWISRMEGKDESTKLWWPFNSIRVLVGTNNVVNREMVVAQLVEQSLLIPEVRGSNPVIGKILRNIYCQLYWKDDNKEK